MQSAVLGQTRRHSRALSISLWIAQCLLAALFGLSGTMKSFLPVSSLVAEGINYASELPLWLLRFIGVAELAGAVGMLLPALTRLLPRLTPLAALGFTAIQILALGFHASRGELARALPLNLVLLSLSLFVLWDVESGSRLCRGRNAAISPVDPAIASGALRESTALLGWRFPRY
jgi:uncharacterized membrane protein YphA (DoxX/SURF4 family)